VAAHENANTVAEAEMKTKIWSVCVIVMALASGAWGHTGKPAQAADFGPNQWITSVAFSGDGRSIFATSFTKPGTFTVTVWDIAKGKSRRALAAPTRSVDNNATLSPDGRTLAATNNAVYFSDDFTIFLWSVTTGRKLHTLSGNGLMIEDLVFSNDGNTLVSGSDDFTIRLFDVATGKQTKLIPTGSDKPKVVAISPDGHTLAAGNDDSPGGESDAGDPMNSIQLWDATTGEVTFTLSSQKFWTSNLVFSPDGRTLASASWDNTITLWDVATGKALRSLSGLADISGPLAFSPDGRTLASGAGDTAIELWDVTTGQALRALTGSTDEPLSVAFSPDGKTLASGGYDNTVKLWDVASGKLLSTFGVPNPPDSSALRTDPLAGAPTLDQP
jgi:WD40 repeat protein